MTALSQIETKKASGSKNGKGQQRVAGGMEWAWDRRPIGCVLYRWSRARVRAVLSAQVASPFSVALSCVSKAKNPSCWQEKDPVSDHREALGMK